MDLLSASATPEARRNFHAIPLVCLPEINYTAQKSQPTDALWKRFAYGNGSHEIQAATPANSSIAARVTEDPEHNFGLVVSLAKHANASNFIVNLKASCAANENDETVTKQVLRHWGQTELPYQIKYAEEYKFDPSNCGRFVNSVSPCWFDVGSNNHYEPSMVLVAPGALPRSECYDPHNKTVDAQDTERRRSKLSEMMSRGDVWHPDEICPDYRLMCGAENPPNLPPAIASCGPVGGRWLQIPYRTCDTSEAVGNCESQVNLRHGRLPKPEDTTMDWRNVAVDSVLCKAPTLEHGEIWSSRFQSTEFLCPGFHRWVPPDDWVANCEESSFCRDTAPGDQDPQNRWDLLKDAHGTYRLVPHNHFPNGGEGIELVEPLSVDRVLKFDGLPARHRFPNSGAVRGRWFHQAALAAALAMACGVAH